MADKTPGGAWVSFGGTTVASIAAIVAVGYPSIPQNPTDASIVSVTGWPVDPLNGAKAPRKPIAKLSVLIQAAANSSTPWTDVMTAYRALASMPETGTLVIKSDANSSATVSCQARRDPLDLTIAPKNAYHLEVPLTFHLFSDWA